MPTKKVGHHANKTTVSQMSRTVRLRINNNTKAVRLIAHRKMLICSANGVCCRVFKYMAGRYLTPSTASHVSAAVAVSTNAMVPTMPTPIDRRDRSASLPSSFDSVYLSVPVETWCARKQKSKVHYL